MTEPCCSGFRTLHRCHDSQTDFDWAQFLAPEADRVQPVLYAYRDEAESPLRWSPVLDMMAVTLSLAPRVLEHEILHATTERRC